MTQEASLPNTQWSCWLKALGEGLFYSCISCDTIKSNKLHENHKKHLGPLGVMHFKDSTVTCHLPTGIRSEECVVRQFRRHVNVIERTYTNLDGIAYYTPRLYGTAYYS